MHIRPIRPDEHAAAGKLIVRAYRQVHDDLGDYADVLTAVAHRVEVGAQVLVAVGDDGELVGCVTYVPPGIAADLTEWDDPPAGGIRMLAVEPSRQGRGIGRALADACVRAAAEQGVPRLHLNTTDRVPAAHRLYRSMGFVRVPDLDVEVDTGLWLRAYLLHLSA